MHPEKSILRKTGEAIKRFDMIREGDRIAVGVSGGKDSIALLESLRLLHRRSPVDFSLCAFTIEQGKFVRPVEPVGEWIRQRGLEWVHFNDQASLDLIEDKPDHGCDLCSRYRRRAVYEVARNLGANVIALGHTADDACESLLRNAMYNGRLSALPAVVQSREGTARIIRPLILVSEQLTTAFVDYLGLAIVPCVCSFKSNTVRGSIRDVMAEPGVKESLLAAIGNIDAARLLDPKFLNSSAHQMEEEPFTILG